MGIIYLHTAKKTVIGLFVFLLLLIIYYKYLSYSTLSHFEDVLLVLPKECGFGEAVRLQPKEGYNIIYFRAASGRKYSRKFDCEEVLTLNQIRPNSLFVSIDDEHYEMFRVGNRYYLKEAKSKKNINVVYQMWLLDYFFTASVILVILLLVDFIMRKDRMLKSVDIAISFFISLLISAFPFLGYLLSLTL